MRRFGLLRRKGGNYQTSLGEPEKSLPKAKRGKAIKEKALVFHTDWTAEEVDIEINNGKALVKYGEPIGDKEFIIDQVRPFIIKSKGRFGSNKLLYLLKWDKLRPCNFVLETNGAGNPNDYIEVDFKPNGGEVRQTLAPFTPEFGQQRGEFKDITPDIMRQTYDLRFLKHMKKYATEGGGRKFSLGSGRGVIMAITFGVVFLITFLFSYSYLGGFG